MIFLLIMAAHAAPVFGVDYMPFGKGDLVSSSNGEQSDYLLAERDGMIRSSLRPWMGWKWRKYRLLGSFDNYYRQKNRSFEQENIQSHVGVIRLGIDLQRKIHSAKKIAIFGGMGIHGNIPMVSIESTRFTKEEQEEYDLLASQIKSEIGGTGGRVSVGAEHRWDSGFLPGFSL